MKYRKKPVEVEAVRWEGDIQSSQQLFDLLGGGIHKDCKMWIPHVPYNDKIDTGGNPLTDEPYVVKIGTLEGMMTAQVGDWIIKGVKDEVYPCKPDIFDATYEKVTDEAN